jgi:putative membrane protein
MFAVSRSCMFRGDPAGRTSVVRQMKENTMIRTSRAFFSGTAALLLGIAANLAVAAEGENFVDEASAKGIAEIETAKMALTKGTSEDVKTFAQKMIDDHTMANQKLAELAGQHEDLEISDDATLMDKAKAMILRLRDGENFDKAYANNQVVAHEQTIEMFREYIKDGENAELKKFAEQTLPKLEEHLQMAKQMQSAHGAKD